MRASLRVFVLVLAACACASGQSTRDTILNSVRRLTSASELVRPSVQALTIQDGALLVIGQGTLVRVINGYKDLVDQMAAGLRDMTDAKKIDSTDDSAYVRDALDTFQKVQCQVLDTLKQKSGLFVTIPFVGMPVTTSLRAFEQASDAYIFGVSDLLTADDGKAARDDGHALRGCVHAAIDAYSPASNHAQLTITSTVRNGLDGSGNAVAGIGTESGTGSGTESTSEVVTTVLKDVTSISDDLQSAVDSINSQDGPALMFWKGNLYATVQGYSDVNGKIAAALRQLVGAEMIDSNYDVESVTDALHDFKTSQCKVLDALKEKATLFDSMIYAKQSVHSILESFEEFTDSLADMIVERMPQDYHKEVQDMHDALSTCVSNAISAYSYSTDELSANVGTIRMVPEIPKVRAIKPSRKIMV